MTRKRFVKLLMANGYSRDSANGEAAPVQYLDYLSYQERYRYLIGMKRWESDLSDAFSNLANSFEQATDAMGVLYASLKNR